jgi:hypothetical protein
MSYLRCLYLFVYIGVQHILSMLPVSLDCPFLIVPLVYSLAFIYIN